MHSFVTVAIPFKAEYSQEVKTVLDQIGNPAGSELKEPLDTAGFVHFMSITLVNGDVGSQSYILIELTADEAIPEVFGRIATTIGRLLRTVIDAAQVETDGIPLALYLRRHHLPVGQGWFSTAGLNYDGTPGMTVRRIRREHELAKTVSKLINELPASDAALETLARIREWLWADEAQKWAFVPEPAPILGPAPSRVSTIPSVLASAVASLLWPFLLSGVIAFVLAWWARGITSGVCVAALFTIAAAFVKPRWVFLTAAVVSLALGWFAGAYVTALWVATVLLISEFGGAYTLLRRKEEKDVPEDVSPSATLVKEIMSRENFGAQNHMAGTSTMKAGRFRRLTLRVGFWVAGQFAEHFSAPGFLGTTGVIHFARWILLPGTNKLIFRSNFDGTWERYLEDFIELAYQGINGIWSNAVGFPKTWNLFAGGARDSDRLRRWMRRQQQPTLVWYSAYPQLTLARIRTNAAIRQGITSALTEADAVDWLSCFGSAPRPADLVESAEIPTLVFGGLRRLRYGTCMLLRLEQTNARTWLAAIQDDLSFDDQYTATSVMLVGFSYSGLSKLGLNPNNLETFPVAFQHGSAAPWRAHALSDTGRNAPNEWLWGGPGAEADAILLIYAREQQSLAQLVNKRLAQLKAANHHVLREVCFAPLPGNGPVREPFGFVDGISDPTIRGVGRWMLPERRHQLVAPGEFILGYPDNLGYIPSSPFVAASDDPSELLPALPANFSHPRPEFSIPQPTEKKDFGRNGTFLVVRHLQQDDEGFNIFLDETARSLAGSDKVPPGDQAWLKEWIAAKLVGRWRDGSSLVRHPLRPGSESANVGQPAAPDNEFLYSVEDPNGLRCPFGAHIRRANPRESLASSHDDPASTIDAIRSGANPFDPLSVAAQEQLAITNRHRILRVGRSYCRQGDLDKPGLIFMCLNTDIERQFEFIQKTWVLGSSFHGLEAESDPLIGQRDRADVMLTIPTANGPFHLRRIQDFVTVRGSGYFFLPGRKAIRFLAQ